MRKEVDYFYIRFLIFFSITLVVLINIKAGLQLSSDAYTYISWSQRLIESDFSLAKFHENSDQLFIYYLYDGFLFYIASLQLLFGHNWLDVFFGLNLLFLSITFLYFFSLIGYSSNTFKTNLFAVFLIFLALDFFLWPHFLLTEGIFIFLLTSFLFFYSRQFFIDLSINKKKNYLFISLVFLILAFFTKPGSLGIVMGILFFSLVNLLKFNEKKTKIFLLILVCFSPILFQVLFSLMPTLESEKFSQLSGYITNGVVIHDRESTYLDSINSSPSQVFLFRFLYFFIPIVPEMSLFHKLVDSLFSILLLLSIILWLLYSGSYTYRHRIVCQLMLFMFIFSGLFHSATLIDYDWRYRFSSLIPMIIFITYNFIELSIKNYDRNNNSSI